MSSEDPELAAAIANALADAYIAVQGAAKQQSNSDATDWLEPEIANLSKRVKEAEARVANFRAQSDLLIGQNNSVLSTQQLSELSTELSRVRANRGAAEANAQSVRAVLESGASLDALPDVLSSTLIQRLRERQVQLKADIADLSTTLLDNHPRIRALRSQLADLDGQIRHEAENVLKGLGSEAKAAQMREKQLVADLNTLKAESAVPAKRRWNCVRWSARPTPSANCLNLSVALSRGLVAQGRQLPAGRRTHLLARRRAVRALFPETAADRRRCLRSFAAGHGYRHAAAGAVFGTRHAPGRRRGCGRPKSQNAMRSPWRPRRSSEKNPLRLFHSLQAPSRLPSSRSLKSRPSTNRREPFPRTEARSPKKPNCPCTAVAGPSSPT